MKKSSSVKTLIFIAGVILTAVYLCGCAKEASKELPKEEMKDKIEAEAFKEPTVSQISKNVKQDIKLAGVGEEQKILSFDMTGYTNDGRKKWDIRGKSADIVSDTVILNDIEANAYSEDRTVILKADRGKYNKKEHSIRLEDNVVVTTSDGIRLVAEWFKWNSDTDKIVTDSFVEVEKDNLYASGYGACASTKEKEVQLNKNILVKQDDVTINCGGPLIIDYGKDKASFYDNVEVTEPRGELIADHLDIFFNKESREMENIVAEGNVELRRKENIAKGQRIVYTIASGEAILTGNPEIHIYSKEDLGDALTGD